MVSRADRWNSAAGVWVRKILERRPFRLVTVALANKMARIAWAVMTRGEVYHLEGRVATVVATASGRLLTGWQTGKRPADPAGSAK